MPVAEPTRSMSYILDALRRAQADRGRGSVPGLHTPATPVGVLPSAAAGSRASRGGPLLWGGLALGVAAALAGWWLWRTPAPAAVVAAAPPAPTRLVEPVAPVVVPPPAPQVAPAPTPSAAPQTIATPPPRQPEPRAAHRPAVPRPEPAPARERAKPAKPMEASKPSAAESPKPAASASVAAAGPVFAQGDLPPSVREQLPTLQLAGITYSVNPLHRMVIVNGQVLHEGDAAGPGLVLERIEPNRTVWAFRGYRYALPSQ